MLLEGSIRKGEEIKDLPGAELRATRSFVCLVNCAKRYSKLNWTKTAKIGTFFLRKDQYGKGRKLILVTQTIPKFSEISRANFYALKSIFRTSDVKLE